MGRHRSNHFDQPLCVFSRETRAPPAKRLVISAMRMLTCIVAQHEPKANQGCSKKTVEPPVLCAFRYAVSMRQGGRGGRQHKKPACKGRGGTGMMRTGKENNLRLADQLETARYSLGLLGDLRTEDTPFRCCRSKDNGKGWFVGWWRVLLGLEVGEGCRKRGYSGPR